MIHDFHFLRPFCFLALLPLAALLAWWWRQRRSGRTWEGIVDARLLPHLLIGGGRGRSLRTLVAIAACGVLAVTAMAGPTWSKLQQPVFRRESALVVLLDLSRSMDATDLTPNRIQMARFKLRDLLDRRKEGETAFVVYAAEPFTVTPLTGDVATIKRQLSSLDPEIMPAQGSRADRAIVMAQTLMQDAGAVRGDVLLITDGVENTPPDALTAAVRKLVAAGYHLSVLGVGTRDGGPIPLKDGGFFSEAGGAIVIPKLDEDSLVRLAALGQGLYRRLGVGDRDIQALTTAFERNSRAGDSRKMEGLKSDQWREAGAWLLLPLLPIAALAFRRGALLGMCLLFLLPLPRNAHALDWPGLWQRPDQRGATALAEERPTEAAAFFKDRQWRAAAHYRAEDYQAALKDLEGEQGAEADYNRGNALAHLGKYLEALKAYDAALKENPSLTDAAHNRDLVEKWLQQQDAKSQKDQKGQDQKQKGRQDERSGENKEGESREGGETGGSQVSSSQGQDGKDEKHGDSDNMNGRDAGDRRPSSSSEQNAAGEKAGRQEAARQGKAQPDQRGQGAEQEKKDASRNDRNGASSEAAAAAASQQSKDESEQATAQWLRRIPDDPGGLWRRKFLYQYKNEHQSRQGEAKPW